MNHDDFLSNASITLLALGVILMPIVLIFLLFYNGSKNLTMFVFCVCGECESRQTPPLDSTCAEIFEQGLKQAIKNGSVYSRFEKREVK